MSDIADDTVEEMHMVAPVVRDIEFLCFLQGHRPSILVCSAVWRLAEIYQWWLVVSFIFFPSPFCSIVVSSRLKHSLFIKSYDARESQNVMRLSPPSKVA